MKRKFTVIVNKRYTYASGGDNMATLEKNRMLKIENEVNKITSTLDFSKSPFVDISSLVEKERFTVRPRLMEIETTGCLFVNDDPENFERLIVVNTIFKNPDNEKDVIFKKSRFITAHEFGHYKLHKPSQQSYYFHRDSDKRDNQIELEADYFARALLMPYNEFSGYLKILNDMAENDPLFVKGTLSSLFGVTKNKVEKRMEDLVTLG